MYIKLLSVFALAITTTTSVLAQNCNGHAELCAKPYNSLTYIMNHNAYGYVANPAANQLCPVSTQLDDGVRGLKLSALSISNTTVGTAADSIQLCHTSCNILNAGTAKDTLSLVATWLKNNPNEVITIMWNNLGGFTPAAFKAAYDAAGLTEYCYTQTSGNFTWPTLSEMINSGKRVVNFVDTGADVTAVNWLLPEWDFVFETPYNNRNESSFSCVIDRPATPASPTESLYVMNHFLYGVLTIGALDIEIPQKGTANVTNAEGSLLKQAQTCTSTFGRQPNFLELDFFNLGQSLEIAAKLNNVTYTAPSQLQCNIYEAAQEAETSSSVGINHFKTMYSTTALLSLVAITFATFL